MPTHAIGQGTVNLNINLHRVEREIIGRAAFSEDRSTGAFIRRMLLRGLETEYPALAAEIKTVREKHRLGARIVAARAASAIILGLFVWVSSTGKTEIRRPSQVRVRRWEEAV